MSARPESVLSGRGLAEVAAERDRLWHSKKVGAGGEVDPGGPAEGEGGARLRLADLAGAVRASAAADPAPGPRDGRRGPARGRRVAPRDQARRLPDRGPRRGRRRDARFPEREGLDEGVPPGRPCRGPAAGGNRAPRRRGRRGASERRDQLPGPPAPRLGRDRAARLLRLRPAAPRRLGPGAGEARGAQGGAAAPRRVGARRHPLQRPRPRPRARVLPEGARDRPRGCREQARRRSLSRGAGRRLAEGEVPPGPGIRDRRLHAGVGRRCLYRCAPRGLLRGRSARVRRQGRIRVQRAPASRPAASTRRAPAGSGPFAEVPAELRRAALGRAGPRGPGRVLRVDRTRAGCASPCSSDCATTARRATSYANGRGRSREAASTPWPRAGRGRRCATTRHARAA